MNQKLIIILEFAGPSQICRGLIGHPGRQNVSRSPGPTVVQVPQRESIFARLYITGAPHTGNPSLRGIHLEYTLHTFFRRKRSDGVVHKIVALGRSDYRVFSRHAIRVCTLGPKPTMSQDVPHSYRSPRTTMNVGRVLCLTLLTNTRTPDKHSRKKGHVRQLPATTVCGKDDVVRLSAAGGLN